MTKEPHHERGGDSSEKWRLASEPGDATARTEKGRARKLTVRPAGSDIAISCRDRAILFVMALGLSPADVAGLPVHAVNVLTVPVGQLRSAGRPLNKEGGRAPRRVVGEAAIFGRRVVVSRNQRIGHPSCLPTGRISCFP